MSERAHELDTEERRVDPRGLREGDVLAAHSPPSQGGADYRIRTVDMLLGADTKGGEVVVVTKEDEAYAWGIDPETGEVDGYAVRLPDDHEEVPR